MKHAVAILVSVLIGALLGFSAPARADDGALPSCPTAPAEYEGDDVVVHELRMLRIEQARSCDRAYQNAKTAHDDAGALVSAVDAAKSATAELGTEGHELLVKSEGSTPGETRTVALSDEDRSRSDAQYAGVRNALWYPVGIAAALVVVTGFVWATRPDR